MMYIILGSSDFHVDKNLTFVLFRYKMGLPIRIISPNWLALDRNWYRFSEIYIIPVKLSNKNPYKSAKSLKYIFNNSRLLERKPCEEKAQKCLCFNTARRLEHEK